MKKERILGLDILRIVAMCGIVGLHMINQGGVINNLKTIDLRYVIVLLLLTIFYLSVNTFAILSGYLGINKKKHNYSRIIELLLIIIFYIIVETIIFYGFNIKNVRALGYKELIKAVFPFGFGFYWYITSYVLLFFLMPHINRYVQSISRKQYKSILIVLLVAFSILPSIIFKQDFFRINDGYDPFWLITMYLLGGYIKMYPPKKNKAFLYVITSIILAFLFNLVIRITFPKSIGGVDLSNWFVNYISPFNVLASASLVLVFSNIKTTKLPIKPIVLLSISSFSVYIFHDYYLFFSYVMKDWLAWTNSISIFTQVVLIFAYIIVVYLIAFVIDMIRRALFKIIKLEKLENAAGDKMEKILEDDS